VPWIHALGDAKEGPQLTPYALVEATALARHLFGTGSRAPDDLVPTAVFGHPPVGSVGLTEEQARLRGDVDVYRSTFVPLRNRLTPREEALVKLVVDRSSQRVLGVHVVGPDAPEIVQGFAVALRCGATKAQFDATLAIHPTLAEELVLLRTPNS
jgi:glutathione reductase (NADPH)